MGDEREKSIVSHMDDKMNDRIMDRESETVEKRRNRRRTNNHP